VPAKIDKHHASHNGQLVLPLEICWLIHKYETVIWLHAGMILYKYKNAQGEQV
jgi:hypothetical protein